MTITGPTARSVTRAARGPVLVVLALVLLTGGFALVTGGTASGALDPRAFDPQGTHALAALLRHGGTDVLLVRDARQAAAQASATTTVVLAFPAELPTVDLARLSGVPGGLLVLGGDQPVLDGLRLAVTAGGVTSEGVRRPACDLALARRAGVVRLGGPGYRSRTGVSCYASGGRAGLVALPGARVLLGSAGPLTNQRLAEQGNAALGLGLLGRSSRVLWLLPTGSATPAGGRSGLLELLPSWVTAAAAQLAVALVVLALGRGRRLGRVVEEPLPVVVRAAETVEGLGRLYRSAKALEAAADALRGASRDRAARRLGLVRPAAGHLAGPGAGSSQRPDGGLVEAAAARTGRSAAQVQDLLYGPVPVDEAALVRLAGDLTLLDTEVAGS